MRIRVLLFGMLQDLLPGESRTLDLPPGSTVQTVLGHYRQIAPEPSELWAALAFAVNREYASLTRALEDGDEVALLPPVSGGSGSSPPQARIGLVREPIDTASIVTALKRECDGAVVVFGGIVRDNSHGRHTVYLVYEAYEEMALRQMNALARDAIAAHRVRDVAIVHRLGRLEVGETSVLIAVASAHRAQAFDACRWLIDTLKTTVPIWKKEYFEDGAIWAPGEPFPAPPLEKGSTAS